MPDAYYDRYWTAAGYNPRRDETPSALREIYAREIIGTAECLDLGCGDGGNSGTYLAEHAARYIGVDVSETGVQLARQRGLEAETIDDAGALPFDDESFDVVVCIEVLEHLFLPHQAVSESARVLRPGGKMIVTVPNAAHWRDRVDMMFGLWHPAGDALGRQQPWRSPHIRFFQQRSLDAMISTHGFAHVAVTGLPESLLLRAPLGRRFVRNRDGGPLSRALIRNRASLLASHLVAVAQK